MATLERRRAVKEVREKELLNPPDQVDAAFFVEARLTD
jgi:hypothetical protein